MAEKEEEGIKGMLIFLLYISFGLAALVYFFYASSSVRVSNTFIH